MLFNFTAHLSTPKEPRPRAHIFQMLLTKKSSSSHTGSSYKFRGALLDEGLSEDVGGARFPSKASKDCWRTARVDLKSLGGTLIRDLGSFKGLCRDYVDKYVWPLPKIRGPNIDPTG